MASLISRTCYLEKYSFLRMLDDFAFYYQVILANFVVSLLFLCKNRSLWVKYVPWVVQIRLVVHRLMNFLLNLILRVAHSSQLKAHQMFSHLRWQYRSGVCNFPYQPACEVFISTAPMVLTICHGASKSSAQPFQTFFKSKNTQKDRKTHFYSIRAGSLLKCNKTPSTHGVYPLCQSSKRNSRIHRSTWWCSQITRRDPKFAGGTMAAFSLSQRGKA